MAAAQSNSKEILFSKKLKDTDIKKRLAIPTKILSSLPSFNGDHAVHIRLVHDTKTWPIVCTVCKKGYSKPVFSRGWRKFVIANKLNVGDKITMYKVQDEDGSFSHCRVEMEQPAIRNQERAFPSLAPSLKHGVDETEFGNEHEKLPETADESIKQEDANVAVDTQLDDVHVIIKVFGLGEAESPLVSSYMAKKESEINFFGLPHEAVAYGYDLAAAGEEWCNSTVSYERLSLDLVLRQPTAHAEQMNLDLTLAPPNA